MLAILSLLMTKTTILIESETRRLLKRVGRKEQTYDELLNELAGERMKRMIKENEDLFGSGIDTPSAKQTSADEHTGAGATV
jgi:hypothetical protein